MARVLQNLITRSSESVQNLVCGCPDDTDTPVYFNAYLKTGQGIQAPFVSTEAPESHYISHH